MPARHKSLQRGLLLEADFKLTGSGRRKRVSARHQVKRLDRPFEGFALCQDRSGRRNKFLRSVRLPPGSAISPASRPQPALWPKVKSGPDVFADALVPHLSALMPGVPISQIPQPMDPIIHGGRGSAGRA